MNDLKRKIEKEQYVNSTAILEASFSLGEILKSAFVKGRETKTLELQAFEVIRFIKHFTFKFTVRGRVYYFFGFENYVESEFNIFEAYHSSAFRMLILEISDTVCRQALNCGVLLRRGRDIYNLKNEIRFKSTRRTKFCLLSEHHICRHILTLQIVLTILAMVL